MKATDLLRQQHREFEELFRQITDDLVYHGDVNNALRRLMQQGFTIEEIQRKLVVKGLAATAGAKAAIEAAGGSVQDAPGAAAG